MRRFILPLTAFLFLVGFVMAAAPDPQVYSAADSARHIGEVATIVGRVDSVRVLNSGMTLVNLDGRYPHQAFTIVVRASDAQTVGDLKSFGGKRVRVTGKITEYRGKQQIEVTARTQIVEDTR